MVSVTDPYGRILGFLDASWKACSLRMFSTACDSASITSIVPTWRHFSFIFDRGNREVGRVGDDGHVFCQRFPGEKEVWDGALSWCNSQFFCHQSSGRILRTFSLSPYNFTVVWRIDCLDCQDELFVNKPLDMKENDEHALDFALHPTRLFLSRWVWTFPLGAHSFFHERLCNHFQGLRLTFPKISTRFDAVP
jgi:hypothetical protein